VNDRRTCWVWESIEADYLAFREPDPVADLFERHHGKSTGYCDVGLIIARDILHFVGSEWISAKCAIVASCFGFPYPEDLSTNSRAAISDRYWNLAVSTAEPLAKLTA
jgi:hypothetical protein